MHSSATVHQAASRPIVAYLDPIAMVRGLWSHRRLAWGLARRELSLRYKQTMLGALWAVLTPLVTLAIYVFAFALVLGARFESDPNAPAGAYAIQLLAGLLIYRMFAEVISSSPRLVLSHRNFVKKVVFPLEVLPLSDMMTAMVNMAIGYAVWIVGALILIPEHLSWTMVLFPLVVVPHVLMTAALSWVVASIGVFIRDIGLTVGLIVHLLFFATPIMYSMERVPEAMRPILWLNPLTHVVVNAREVLVFGRVPDLAWLGVATVVSAAAAVAGYAFFMKSKRAFADVL